jgi:hypothetical protein
MTPFPLSAYQSAFARALNAANPLTVAPELAALVQQPGFAVYRNTVLKGCIDALQANYPAVARLVGDEWFRAAAAEFVRGNPPERPMLIEYGEEFAGFLAVFEPAAAMSYLAGVAALDRFWAEAHTAADAAVLDAATLAAMTPERTRDVTLIPHPAARWRWFADQPVYTIWSRNRGDGDPAADLEWRGEGALLTRPHADVRWTSTSAAGVAFLDSCAAGHSIERAVIAALGADPKADLASLVHQLLSVGAFTALAPSISTESVS